MVFNQIMSESPSLRKHYESSRLSCELQKSMNNYKSKVRSSPSVHGKRKHVFNNAPGNPSQSCFGVFALLQLHWSGEITEIVVQSQCDPYRLGYSADVAASPCAWFWCHHAPANYDSTGTSEFQRSHGAVASSTSLSRLHWISLLFESKPR